MSARRPHAAGRGTLPRPHPNGNHPGRRPPGAGPPDDPAEATLRCLVESSRDDPEVYEWLKALRDRGERGPLVVV
jgi:hypothetical protein